MVPVDHFRHSLSSRGALIASAFVAVATAALAFWYRTELIDALQRVHIGWTFAGLGFYGLNYHLRASRFRILSAGRIRIWPEGLHASCIHGFASYMMPFRSGELALPIIIRSLTNLNLAEGGQILVRARLLDVFCLGMWCFAAAIISYRSLPAALFKIWLLAATIMLVLPLIIHRLALQGRSARYALVRKVGDLVQPQAFRMGEILVSMGIWGSVAGVFFCTAKAIELPIDFLHVWWLITLQLPLQLIPLQGLANAGNHEGGWVAGLTLLGFSTSQSIAFALTSHAVLIMYVILLGPVALITGRFCRKPPAI